MALKSGDFYTGIFVPGDRGFGDFLKIWGYLYPGFFSNPEDWRFFGDGDFFFVGWSIPTKSHLRV